MQTVLIYAMDCFFCGETLEFQLINEPVIGKCGKRRIRMCDSSVLAWLVVAPSGIVALLLELAELVMSSISSAAESSVSSTS